MGRMSQFFWYINAKEHPSALQQAHHYTHLEITEELKKIRQKYRKEAKDAKKENAQ